MVVAVGKGTRRWLRTGAAGTDASHNPLRVERTLAPLHRVQEPWYAFSFSLFSLLTLSLSLTSSPILSLQLSPSVRIRRYTLSLCRAFHARSDSRFVSLSSSSVPSRTPWSPTLPWR